MFKNLIWCPEQYHILSTTNCLILFIDCIQQLSKTYIYLAVFINDWLHLQKVSLCLFFPSFWGAFLIGKSNSVSSLKALVSLLQSTSLISSECWSYCLWVMSVLCFEYLDFAVKTIVDNKCWFHYSLAKDNVI